MCHLGCVQAIIPRLDSTGKYVGEDDGVALVLSPVLIRTAEHFVQNMSCIGHRDKICVVSFGVLC